MLKLPHPSCLGTETVKSPCMQLNYWQELAKMSCHIIRDVISGSLPMFFSIQSMNASKMILGTSRRQLKMADNPTQTQLHRTSSGHVVVDLLPEESDFYSSLVTTDSENYIGSLLIVQPISCASCCETAKFSQKLFVPALYTNTLAGAIASRLGYQWPVNSMKLWQWIHIS